MSSLARTLKTGLALSIFIGSSLSLAEYKPKPVKNRLAFAEYRVLSPEGKVVWNYTTFMLENRRSPTATTIMGYLDAPDLGAMLIPTLESHVSTIPGRDLSLSEGMIMSIASNGYSKSEPLPEGGRLVHVENHLANWWSMEGDIRIDKLGVQKGRMEYRNKAHELVSIYEFNSRPATEEEQKTFEHRIAITKESNLTPAEFVDYNVKRSRVSYPDKLDRSP